MITVYIIVLNTDNWGDSVGRQIPFIETTERVGVGPWDSTDSGHSLLITSFYQYPSLAVYKFCSLPSLSYLFSFQTVFDIEY